MKNHRKIKEYFSDLIVFIFGSCLISLAINCFLSRNNILNGGFTGIATILNYLFNIPIGFTIFLLNVPLFILAFKKLGTKFIFRTICATVIMSALIDAGEFLPIYSNDFLLCAIFGGALSGIGLGIIFIRNATTGGVDIIAKLIKLRYSHISLGRTFLIFDAAVTLLGGLVYQNLESVLYATVTIFVSSQAIDYIVFGVNRGSMLFIITESYEPVKNIALNKFQRGITVLKGYGGYTDNEKRVIICVCDDNQVNKLIKEIKTVDENAFFVVTQARQILGKGFKNI